VIQSSGVQFEVAVLRVIVHYIHTSVDITCICWVVVCVLLEFCSTVSKSGITDLGNKAWFTDPIAAKHSHRYSSMHTGEQVRVTLSILSYHR